MKKLSYAIGLVGMIVAFFSAPGVAADDSWERVKAAGKLVIGIDDAFPPMEFRNEQNELVGFDIDASRELGKRLGIEIVKDVYRLTSRFPQHELYGLTGQMRRSAISIPSNVAEGFRRQYAKEYRQFLRVSLGSCAELETQTTIARELSYMSIGEEAELLDKLDHECRMISSLTKKL